MATASRYARGACAQQREPQQGHPTNSHGTVQGQALTPTFSQGERGPSTVHTPRNSRLPKLSASEASKIFWAADSMSYSTRRYSTVRAPVSQITKHARLS